MEYTTQLRYNRNILLKIRDLKITQEEKDLDWRQFYTLRAAYKKRYHWCYQEQRNAWHMLNKNFNLKIRGEES